jgi:G3E family GTPase
MQRFALTLIQGARGSGKSTLLDAAFARGDARRVVRLAVPRTAGLGAQLAELADAPIDHVVAELGGATRPELLVDAVLSPAPRRSARRLVGERVRVVTVVDGTRFLSDLTSEALTDDDPVQPFPLAVLLAEQAEASDVLVLSKADLLSSEAQRVVLAVLAELNPAAPILVARHGRVLGMDLLAPPAPELEPGRSSKSNDVFDPAAQQRASLGVSSYVYRARRPFHPARLRAHLLGGWPGVIRSRGIFWLATRMAEAGAWSQVGPIWQTSRGGFWWSALEEQGWPIPEGIGGAVRAEWSEPFGDRRQELTLIGFELDTRALAAGFAACLLSAEELDAGPDAWSQLRDPFPDWSPASADVREPPPPLAPEPPRLSSRPLG